MKRLVFLFCVLVLLCSGAARAELVDVAVDSDPGDTNTSLRERTRAEGFAQALLVESLKVLPGPIGEPRQDALRQYFVDHSAGLVTGYQEMGASRTEHGLRMTLDVQINRRALRERLQTLGLTETWQQPVRAGVVLSGEFSEEQRAEVDGLVELTGVAVTPSALPEITLRPAGDGTFAGVMRVPSGELWPSAGATVSDAWLVLWNRYFESRAAQMATSGGQVLRVTGWFTPDGVQEFDRVLQEWDNAVQRADLVDMELLPTGVTARWDIRVEDLGALRARLEDYLPGRGLDYALLGPGM